MQWKQMGWPIMVDSLNLLGVTVVPITLLIDENGVIVKKANRASAVGEFLARPAAERTEIDRIAPDFRAMMAKAKSARDHRTVGDAMFLFGTDTRRWDAAIEVYRQAIKLDPKDPTARFRLGVTLRRRYETETRRGTDFGAAVDAWREALDINPNNYIWRRRIQQYGPALAKPYPFYDWVAQANKDITSRGEVPTALSAPLTDSESLSKKPFVAQNEEPENPDPNGRIDTDEKRWIRIESAVAPAMGRSDPALRVHVVLRADDKRKIHWNNESEPLRIWFDTPAGWKINRSLSVVANSTTATSDELRRIEVELQPPANSTVARLRGYALYNVCEGAGGTCRFLRQDFVVELNAAR